jgi:DNA helicase HerA-like ATPase
MAIKIGSVHKINNRNIEISFDEDVLSRPTAIQGQLNIVGSLNSYVSIPLFNYQEAIGIIYEESDESRHDTSLFQSNPELFTSKIKLIGTYDQRSEKFKKGIDLYPTMKAEVFAVEKDVLEKIYNSSFEAGTPVLEIGTDVFFPDVSINANPNILFGKHCAVFGNTGSGKSCTVASILQSIYGESGRLKNVVNKKLKTIIIDSNDEYSKIFDTSDACPEYVQLLKSDEINLSHKDLTFYELTALLKEYSPNVATYLRAAICELKDVDNVDESVYYDFSELEARILRQVPLRNGVPDNFIAGFLQHVIRRINNFANDARFACVFSAEANSIYDFLNSSKQVLIISLKVSNDVLSLISYMISKSIFNYKSHMENRDKENILLVLEEAHRYISSDSNEEMNNYYVEKLAREGRKFGVNILISTQRPSEVSQTVISQCNSMIVHKMSNHRDIEFIRNTIEYDDKSHIDMISGLKQQQALVIGEAFAFSSLVKIANAGPTPDSETPKIFFSESQQQAVLQSGTEELV